MSARMLLLLATVLWSNYGLSQSSNMHIRNLYSKTEGPILFNKGLNLILIRANNPHSINVETSKGVNVLSTEVRNDSLLVTAYSYKTDDHHFILTERTSGRIINRIDFEEQEVSEPFVRVGGIKTSEVTKNVLLLQQGLVVANTNENYTYKYVVTKYTLKVDLPTKTAMHADATGPYFTEEIKTILKQLPNNTIIEFDNISATCPDCRNRRFPPIKLLIR